MQRADKPDYWQSVTGSLDFSDELPLDAAVRELFEETGIRAQTQARSESVCNLKKEALITPFVLRPWPHTVEYEIFEHWRHRYPPGTTRNTEHWFAVCVPQGFIPELACTEHMSFCWLGASQAAKRCFSPSNAQAIECLHHFLQTPTGVL